MHATRRGQQLQAKGRPSQWRAFSLPSCHPFPRGRVTRWSTPTPGAPTQQRPRNLNWQLGQKFPGQQASATRCPSRLKGRSSAHRSEARPGHWLPGTRPGHPTSISSAETDHHSVDSFRNSGYEAREGARHRASSLPLSICPPFFQAPTTGTHPRPSSWAGFPCIGPFSEERPPLRGSRPHGRCRTSHF
jgi:hypothetical protein